MVELKEYDPVWVSRFQSEAQWLREVFGDECLWLEHIGSTAVAGLCAKPIIDVLVVARSIKAVDAFNFKLAQRGFWAKGENGIPERRFFIKGSKDNPETHVHVFAAGDARIATYLNFKYYLTAHRAEAQRYMELKRSLASRFPNDTRAYREGKAPFVQSSLEKLPPYLANLSLETPRLILRPFELSDAEAVYVALQDKDIPASTEHIPYPYTREMAVKWIQQHRTQCLAGGQQIFAVALKGEGGPLVGAIGLMANPAHHRGELGYWVAKPHRRRGYATEASRAMVQFGFLRLGYHRISARRFTEYTASARVLEKVGFQHEGRLREDLLKWGEFKDTDVYGLLAREFAYGTDFCREI